MTRYFGEATALMIGFDHAAGDVIVTLPAYLQVEGCEIGKLVAALDALTSSSAIASRGPASWFHTLRHRVFHGLLHFVTRLSFRDLGCNVRALKRKVFEEVHLYGDQQRFLPLLADRQGFRVSQIAVRQSKADHRDELSTAQLHARTSGHLRRILLDPVYKETIEIFRHDRSVDLFSRHSRAHVPGIR